MKYIRIGKRRWYPKVFWDNAGWRIGAVFVLILYAWLFARIFVLWCGGE